MIIKRIKLYASSIVSIFSIIPGNADDIGKKWFFFGKYIGGWYSAYGAGSLETHINISNLFSTIILISSLSIIISEVLIWLSGEKLNSVVRISIFLAVILFIFMRIPIFIMAKSYVI